MRTSSPATAARWTVILAALFCLVVPPTVVRAHDDGKAHDTTPRYEGPGFVGGPAAGEPPVSFDSLGVSLQSWLPLGNFDAALGTTVDGGSDLWGYASPAGREYAIMTFEQGVGFVDVTTPANPRIIAGFAGSRSVWRDVKTYGSYAYLVSDGGVPNVEVYDLGQIDSGLVTRAATISAGPAHNVAIDTTSGFMYRAGSGGAGAAKGVMIYDIGADPLNPPLVGQWGNRYFHDAQAVTYTGGTYAGRQVVFGFSETGSSGGSPGLDILDVTDKSNIQVMSQLTYSNANFSHQGWLSPDRRYLYLNDELDERNLGTPTTTRVIDVSDLVNPVEVGTFTNGSTAIDHNLYTRANLIFESNYRSGLRVFDAADAAHPVEIAYFDTFPGSDSASFSGAWSNYPYLPSGTVLGSDINSGLFVWSVDALSSAQVRGRHVFYNNSSLDAAGDAAALATDKAALLPGQRASAANYTSFDRGINGVMVDVDRLADLGAVDAGDFAFRVGNSDDPAAWEQAPDPLSVLVEPGAGVDGSDRITIIWDDGAIRNQWLQVALKSNVTTGLAGDDVFYFGSAVGDSTLGNPDGVVLVDAADRGGPLAFPSLDADVTNPHDYNRDGVVDAADRRIARAGAAGLLDGLLLLTAPGGPLPAAHGVPEPATGSLAILLGLILSAVQVRRMRSWTAPR